MKNFLKLTSVATLIIVALITQGCGAWDAIFDNEVKDLEGKTVSSFEADEDIATKGGDLRVNRIPIEIGKQDTLEMEWEATPKTKEGEIVYVKIDGEWEVLEDPIYFAVKIEDDTSPLAEGDVILKVNKSREEGRWDLLIERNPDPDAELPPPPSPTKTDTADDKKEESADDEEPADDEAPVAVEEEEKKETPPTGDGTSGTSDDDPAINWKGVY